MKKSIVISLFAAAAFPLAALAAGTHAGGHDMPASHGNMSMSEHSAMFGQPGDPAKVTRTIDVVMNDNMRFDPSSINVKEGETVRFMVRNAGKIRHEMVLGSLDELKEHAKEMRANPGMVHSEPNQVNLKPGQGKRVNIGNPGSGQRGTMVWQFTQPGKVDFACTEPGHLEAGMAGQVEVAH